MLKIPKNTRFSSISQFAFIKDQQLGSGSFGTVALARHKTTCRMYAVKIIKASLSQTQTRLVERQIQLHSQLDHPHLIRLWDTLIEDNTIYMIMEYAQQGNLFYHQNHTTTFSQLQSFKFFIQTVQAVGYIHKNNIMHRDLKPQNLLLDQYFNIKLCDFGWSAQDINLKRNTFCGTYEYMAPQMLFQGQYDYRVDIWALGILLYELLHGFAPFKGKNAEDVQISMVQGKYYVNPSLSAEVKELISRILQIQPEKRATVPEILQHPWVKIMEHQINSVLKQEKVNCPKQIHSKISKMTSQKHQRASKPKESEHRKNASMNIEPSSSSKKLDSTLGKKGIKKGHLSHEKENDETQIVQILSPAKGLKQGYSGILRKGKMEGAKTQMNENEMHRFLDKIKGKKSVKIVKQLPTFDHSQFYNSTDGRKRKSKNNISEVEMLAQKYPIRFNTEAFDRDDWQPNSKLKKSNINSKLLNYSRSAMRFQKTRVDLKF